MKLFQRRFCLLLLLLLLLCAPMRAAFALSLPPTTDLPNHADTLLPATEGAPIGEIVPADHTATPTPMETPVPTPPTRDVNYDAVVTATQASLYSETQVNSMLISILPGGTRVRCVQLVTDTKGIAWTRVQIQGLTGYIQSQFLGRVENAPAATAQPTPEAAAITQTLPPQTIDKTDKEYLQVTVESVNVYSAPDTGSAIYGTWGLDTVVSCDHIVQDANGRTWYHIVTPGAPGYIRGDCLGPVRMKDPFGPMRETPPPLALTTVPADNEIESTGGAAPLYYEGTGFLAAAFDGVSLRSGPYPYAGVKQALAKGDVVRLIGNGKPSFANQESFAWYQVASREEVGYVRDDQLIPPTKESVRAFVSELLDASPQMETADAGEVWATVTGNRVNLRDEPNQYGKILAKLSAGDQVLVLDTITDAANAAWYKVRFDDMEGYVHSDYLAQ